MSKKQREKKTSRSQSAGVIACITLTAGIAALLVCGEKMSVGETGLQLSGGRSVSAETLPTVADTLRQSDAETKNMPEQSDSEAPAEESKAVQQQEAVEEQPKDLFEHLEISDFKTEKSDGSYVISCKVKNNNAQKIFGYFRVYFYDESGKVLRQQMIDVPDLESGAEAEVTANCAESLFPANYAKYECKDAAISVWKPYGADATKTS